MKTETNDAPTTVDGILGQKSESLATEPTVNNAQEQPQETVSSPVETSQQPTSSPSAPRLRPSEHYEIRKLRNQLKEQSELVKQFISQNKSTPVAEPVEKAEDFWVDPEKWSLEREKQLRDEFETKIKSLKEEFPQFIQSTQQAEILKRQEQEALELLFPQDKSNPVESLEDRISRDTVRLQRIQSIIEKYGLSESLNKYPTKSTENILKLLAIEFPAESVNQTVPKKAQMVSTATSTPAQRGDKKSMTLSEIQKELAMLSRQQEEDSKIRFDPAFTSKRDRLKSELLKRYQELSGKQE